MQFRLRRFEPFVQSAAQRVRASNPFARAPRSTVGRMLYGAIALLLAIPVAILIVALLLCGFACVVLFAALFVAFALLRAGLRLIAPASAGRRDLSQPDDFGRENVRVRGRSPEAE